MRILYCSGGWIERKKFEPLQRAHSPQLDFDKPFGHEPFGRELRVERLRVE